MNSRQKTWLPLRGGSPQSSQRSRDSRAPDGRRRIARNSPQRRVAELRGLPAACGLLGARLRLAGVVALLAAVPAAVGESSAAEQGWERSRGKFARYGLITQSCLRAGHTETCLGLACRAGRLELVSAAGGGGPLNGPTNVGFGGRLLKVTFTEDTRALDVLGISASRSTIRLEALRAMAAAPAIEVRSGQGNVKLQFRTAGLRAELGRAENICSARASTPR